MTYQEALDYLYNRLPMFQRMGAPAIKKDLTNTIKLLDALGNPQNHFKSIHIAGTNGKGTSAHALSSILQSAGYKTGLYTSPHLKSFTERIRINGDEVDSVFISDFVTKHQSLIESINPSFFEVTVAMAFQYFANEKVDITVIETGLGGRLDSTNVIQPEVSLITMIGWDHADLLGDTLEKIAGEKAGIIKPSTPVVIGADQPDLLSVFIKKANQVKADLISCEHIRVSIKERQPLFQIVNVASETNTFESLKTDITASYFTKNIPGIIRVIEVLGTQGWNISDQSVYDGFSNIKKLSGLKGRWQQLGENPLVIADCSHNEPGLRLLFEQVQEMNFTKVHVVFGVVKDKDLARILPLFPDEATFYFTESHVPRSMKATDLQESALAYGIKGEAFEEVNHAIASATKNASGKDLILICGSTFVVAEIEEL